MLAPELKSQINKLWDRFWSGGIANPLTAIEQMSYLIFMKRLEDLDTIHQKRASARKETYKSVFEGCENCRWSQWKHLNAEDMLKHVQITVFPFIKELHNGDDTLYSHYMKDAVFVIPKASLLQEAVAIIDEMNITERNQDTQGDIYEYLLNQLKTSGLNGQFRTPRHIIRMMVELVDPDIGQTICDPACGTAGFLICAYEHILKKYTSPDIMQFDGDGVAHNLVGDKIVEKAHWNLLKRETFYGFDFDTTMIRIGLMNMILHGIERPNIKYADTLSKKFEQEAIYDIVFANPPFAGSIDKSDINDDFKTDTTKTELLFLELFHNLLRLGGRAGVIVPTGVLEADTTTHLSLRKMLVENNQLEAIITLPHSTFKPYASVATAVLIFTKGGKTDKVWMYSVEHDGFSQDSIRVSINENDLPELIRLWKIRDSNLYHPQNGKHCWVDIEEIRGKGYYLSPKTYYDILLQHGKYTEIAIGDLCYLSRGSVGATKAIPGDYPFVSTASEIGTHNEYHFEGDAVCVPLVSSTGHGHASIKRITYISGKFDAASIIAVLQVRDKNELDIKYLYCLLQSLKDELLVPKMKGAANVSLSLEKIASIRIPLPTINEQERLIRDIVFYQEESESLKKKLKVSEANLVISLSEFKNHFINQKISN